MARLSKIPPNIHEDLLKKAGEGLSNQKVADWLKDKYNINISQSSVARVLNDLKEERKEAAQRAYADAVAKSANTDLFIIEDIINKLKSTFDELLENGQVLRAKAVADVLFKFISKRMDLSGINNPKTNTDSLKEEILKKIQEF